MKFGDVPCHNSTHAPIKCVHVHKLLVWLHSGMQDDCGRGSVCGLEYSTHVGIDNVLIGQLSYYKLCLGL